MNERTPSGTVLIAALLVGSTIGGVGFAAAMTDSFAELVSDLSLLAVLGLGVAGAIFGVAPFILIGLPACLALERRGNSAIVKTSILAVGGVAVGGAIGVWWPDSRMMIWPMMVGGCTGFTLGVLRRNAPSS